MFRVYEKDTSFQNSLNLSMKFSLVVTAVPSDDCISNICLQAKHADLTYIYVCVGGCMTPF